MTNAALSATVVENRLTFFEEVSAYEILSTTGQTLISGSSKEVEVSQLQNGLYIVKAVREDGQVATYRILKK